MDSYVGLMQGIYTKPVESFSLQSATRRIYVCFYGFKIAQQTSAVWRVSFYVDPCKKMNTSLQIIYMKVLEYTPTY